MTYQHLSQIERYQIFSLMKAGQNQTQIAHFLGRSKSTISREVRRNRGLRGYRPRQAQHLCDSRSLESRNARKICPLLWYEAAGRIALQWSPAQVSGGLPVSHEALYQRIYADKASGGSLWKNLRCQKKRRKRYASGRDRRGQIVGRRPISERPAHIESRRSIGHWEGDTVIGAGHKQAIVSLVERKSGYVVLAKVSNKTAELVSDAIIKGLLPIGSSVKTITFDNGREFAGHSAIDSALGSTSYFADPYASWQRGSNENLNGLIRQYAPKKRPFSTVTDEEIKMIQDRLNHRPRKRLGFKTPHEVFHAFHKPVALRA
jgi:IS30 family transposase